MRRRTVIGAALAAAAAWPALAAGPEATAGDFSFAAIEGGSIDLAAFAGGPVLVVNTASLCGFTQQYAGLQALQDAYRERGLTVVGVPSNSFRQELGDAAAVKEFCEVNFAIDFPLADITPVAGDDAHPFYLWAAAQDAGPEWNFHKILVDGQGRLAGAWGPGTTPDSPDLVAAVEAALPQR